MNTELENKLIKKYPKIFIDANKSPQESCMYWGLEVGDGWYDLIDVLCEALTYVYTTSIKIDEEDGKRLGIEGYAFNGGTDMNYFFKVNPPQVVADQVKEKFGELRFYYHLEYSKDNLSLVDTKKYPELEAINKRYCDFIDGIVHFASIASSKTCEVTGTVGVMQKRGGWWKVISLDTAKTEPYIGYKIPVPKEIEPTSSLFIGYKIPEPKEIEPTSSLFDNILIKTDA